MKRNYRLCYRPSRAPTLQIHEVFYDEADRIVLYEQEPAAAFGDDKDELYENFAEMWKAFDEEPIDLDRADKKIFLRMINDEFNDVYDRHMQQKNESDPESGSK